VAGFFVAAFLTVAFLAAGFVLAGFLADTIGIDFKPNIGAR
jgi:hypothetical protein